MNSTYYGWVGIPINYLYETTQDIDRLNLKLRNKSIDWNGKYGEILEKSLVLTEDEKLFGIMRTVLELRNHNHIHGTLIPTGTIFGLYVSAQALNKKLNLFQMHRFVSTNSLVISNRGILLLSNLEFYWMFALNRAEYLFMDFCRHLLMEFIQFSPTL